MYTTNIDIAVLHTLDWFESEWCKLDSEPFIGLIAYKVHDERKIKLKHANIYCEHFYIPSTFPLYFYFDS